MSQLTERSDKELERGASTPTLRFHLDSGNDNEHKDALNSRTKGPFMWKNVLLNFTPAWFAATMGTGITAILLEKLPYQFHGLHSIAIAIFVLNIVLFSGFLGIMVAQHLLWPDKFMTMIYHPVQSLFLGTIPMGFATLVNLVVYICVPAWGPWAVTLAWVMWWIDVVFSVAVCTFVPFILTFRHDTSLERMTAAWLLPIVATIVAAASGGIVASVLENEHDVALTLVVSYILWGMGVPFAMLILAVYFQRLAFHKLPPRAVIVSVFLPLGPLGQGSFGIMQLGRVFKDRLSNSGFLSPIAGEVLYDVGTLVAFAMWGFALVWLFFAIGALSLGRFPFNLGWWAFTFPLGVFTTATTMFGTELSSTAFKVIGTMLSICVTLLWLVVLSGTIWKSATGELFLV